MAGAVGNATPNLEPNSTTTTVLNTDIETLSTAKNTVRVAPVKEASDSAIAILTFVRVRIPVLLPFLYAHLLQHEQNEMINDDALVELARYCARMCHVLGDVTQGMVTDSLGGPSKMAIDDLGGYVDLVHSSASTITSDIRILRNIKFVVSEHRKAVRDSQEHHPSSTEERLIAWRTELWEILRVLDVGGCKFVVPRFLKYLRRSWCWMVPTRSARLNNTCRNPPTPKPKRQIPKQCVIFLSPHTVPR